MIRYIILATISFFCLTTNVVGQTIEWQFAAKDSIAGDCTSLTNCGSNEVCYFIEYTPSATGTLTSYTMGFIANCLGGGDPVEYSNSCVINDNSNTIDGCASFDSLLIQISGVGGVDVVANEPIIIHQICFDLSEGEELNIKEDEISGITANIDSIGSQNSIAEVIEFDPILLTNDVCECYKLTPGSGSPNQTLTCLTPIQPIEYTITNCNGATVVGLAPGLSHVLINGVINIEGTPNRSGTFTFAIIPDSGCDCETKYGTFTVGNSRVMIENVCYDNIEDAISDYQNGQTIDILDHLTTTTGPLVLTNMTVRLHKNIKWIKK